jgi:hypothetical protein
MITQSFHYLNYNDASIFLCLYFFCFFIRLVLCKLTKAERASMNFLLLLILQFFSLKIIFKMYTQSRKIKGTFFIPFNYLLKKGKEQRRCRMTFKRTKNIPQSFKYHCLQIIVKIHSELIEYLSFYPKSTQLSLSTTITL